MSIKLEMLFKENLNIKRIIPSVKVIAGIIGMCWISPSMNRQIAKTIKVSDSVISEAINNHLLLSNLIIPYENVPNQKRISYTINFIGLIDYLTELLGSEFKGRKEAILYTLMNNRVSVGRSFLESFILNGTYKKGLKKVKNLYESIPELLILLILSIDATAPKNREYLNFLRCFYNVIIKKFENEKPELLYVWSGLAWFMIELE